MYGFNNGGQANSLNYFGSPSINPSAYPNQFQGIRNSTREENKHPYFSPDAYQAKTPLLGSGLKGAIAPGEKLKGSYTKPLGRRPGNASGLSQIGKYIAQGNNLNPLDVGYNPRVDAQNSSFMPYDRNQIDPYQGMNNPASYPVANLSHQFNQIPSTGGYYSNLSKQNDIFEKLIQEMNSAKARPRQDEEIMNRLEQLEIKNMKLQKQIKKEQEKQSSRSAIPAQPEFSQPTMPFNMMPNFPFNQYFNPNEAKNPEEEKEQRRLKKEEKKRKKHEKKRKMKEKDRKKRRKQRERMRKLNPDISLSSSSEDDDDSSSSYDGKDEEAHKRQIERMLKDANKDDPYKYQKDLDKYKDKMEKDKYFKSKLLDDLNIPAFDKNEKVKFDIPDNDEEFEKLEENKRIRADKLAEHERIANQINKLNLNNRKKLKGKAKLAIYSRAIYEWIHLLRMIRGRELKKREDYVNSFKEGLPLYIDVGKAWIIKCIKPTIVSLLQDQSISLDFVDASSSSKIESSFLKAKVRVEAIVKSIHKNINAKDVPFPFIYYLDSTTSHNAFIPNNFLTTFEIHRVNISKYGSLENPTHEMKQMIIGFFIFGIVLVGKICLHPEDIGMKIKINEQTKKNFKIIASIIWHAFLKYIKTAAKAIDPENDNDFTEKNGRKYPKKPTDIISEDLFTQRDLMHIYQRELIWMGQMSLEIGKSLKNFVDLIEKKEEVKKIQEKL